MAISKTDCIQQIRKQLASAENHGLSQYACKSSRAIRKRSETRLDTEYRGHFSVDCDRILNALSYTRYIDKTQVFSLIKNDHITHRVLHVQLLSKISRTIGQALGLNTDLIEAISLGHDIGHPPFGHDGEKWLSEICQEKGIGEFHHNVQSIRFLDLIEKNGRGWNLTLQTLDGILCHNGEVHNDSISPDRNKTVDVFEKDLLSVTSGSKKNLVPMTLEGCVVRMADTISYIGRDVEDAILLGLIKRSDLPETITKTLGKTNGTIVYNLVTDIITNSWQKDVIAYSPEMARAILALREFNYTRIYLNPIIKKHLKPVKDLFLYLYDRYLEDLERERETSPIYTFFLNTIKSDYASQTDNRDIVKDFIAGMTDTFFLSQCPASKRPKPIIMTVEDFKAD